MKKFFQFLLILLGVSFCLPVILIFFGSFMSNLELTSNLKPVMLQGLSEYIHWSVLPKYPTGKHYRELFLYTPEFFVVFWNSMKLSVCILGGQLLIAVPAAWAFAVYPFRFRKGLFTLYIVLMLMPFQVTMLSNYIVLEHLHLMNTHAAVILPAIFSTFPVFLMYRGFCDISTELIDASRVDGAGELTIFIRIGLPLSKPSILSAMVLGFLEYWNLIEQPLAFIKSKNLWPLSLLLPEISFSKIGFAFAASVITLLPAVFVFLLGQDYLEKGILTGALKG